MHTHRTRRDPRRRPTGLSNGFTLVEVLVALLILAIGLSIGLGAVMRGRVALELVALQTELDQSLDHLHEAIRSRSIDVVDLAERQTSFVDPFTFELSVMPVPVDRAINHILGLRAEMTATDIVDLFEVRLFASGTRADMQRERSLTTLIYQPGLSRRLERNSPQQDREGPR